MLPVFFLLEVLWFQVLHLNLLIHFEFVSMYGVSSPVLQVAVRFPKSFIEEAVFFLLYVPYHRLIDDIHVGLFLGSLFFSIDLCMFLCQYHAILITITL